MADPGWERSVAALALSVACGLVSPVRAAMCEPEPRRAELHVLLIELVVFRGIGGSQVDLLRTEIEGVWAEQGVTIAWTSKPTPASVRVVIDRPVTPLPQASVEGMWSVAHARVVQGHIVPPIYASADAAERVVRAATQASSSRGSSGPLLPRVLGRAIAHELAHLLLDTRTHTARGLLRERFTAAEFVAPDLEQFALDPGQRLAAHDHRLLLVARVLGGPPSDASVSAAAPRRSVQVTSASALEPRPCSFVALSRPVSSVELPEASWLPLHSKE